MQAKMKGPEGNGGLSYGGVSYAPDKQGIVTIPLEAVGAAMSHGFILVADKPEPQPTPPAEPQGGEAGDAGKPEDPQADDGAQGDGAEEPPAKPDLSKMTKAELVTYAKTVLGMELVPDSMTKAAMIESIEAAQGGEAGDSAE